MDWRNKPNQIFNKVKHQMFGKGVESFKWADQFICQFDPDANNTLTSHSFNLLLNKIGVFLTTQEIRNVRDLYQPAPRTAPHTQTRTPSSTATSSRTSNTPSLRRWPR